MNESKRLIFQPTEENRKKIERIAERNGVSISLLMNLILDEVDIDTEVSIQLKKNQK